MSVFLNRANIEKINRIKSLWGADRFSQTNSTGNGHFLRHIRLYETSSDKTARRNPIFSGADLDDAEKMAVERASETAK